MLGKEGRPSLAIRSSGPTGNRIASLTVALFFAFLVFYVTYELGRYNGSYDHLAVSQERTELEVQIERLESTNRQLRTQLAEFETFKVGREREQAEVERTIGDLQGQVARESQQLAFYKSIMQKAAPVELGVRLGEVRVSHSSRTGGFIVHVSLLRSGRPDNLVSGTLTLKVDGESGTVVDLAELTGGKDRELPFEFQYYKNFDQPVTLPQGFKPLHLGIDIRSAKGDAPPLTQTVLWNVVP